MEKNKEIGANTTGILSALAPTELGDYKGGTPPDRPYKSPCHWHNAWAAPLSSIYDVLTCEWCGSMLAARQCAGCRGFYPDTAYEPEIDLVRCPSPQIQWGLLCCPCAALAEEQDPHPSPLPPGEREKESGGAI